MQVAAFLKMLSLAENDIFDCRYDKMIEAFQGQGYHVKTAKELERVAQKAFLERKPALINLVLDPYAGVESGNVHSFNAPKSNL